MIALLELAYRFADVSSRVYKTEHS